MDVSSAPQQKPLESGTSPIVKAVEVQEKQVEKIIESANEQSKIADAQKTGMGNSINLIA